MKKKIIVVLIVSLIGLSILYFSCSKNIENSNTFPQNHELRHEGLMHWFLIRIMRYIAFDTETKRKVGEANYLPYLRTICRNFNSEKTYRIYLENKNKKLFLGTYDAKARKFYYEHGAKERLNTLKYGNKNQVKTWYESRINEEFITRAEMLANVKHKTFTDLGYTTYDVYFCSTRREAKIAKFKNGKLHYLNGYRAAMSYVKEEK